MSRKSDNKAIESRLGFSSSKEVNILKEKIASLDESNKKLTNKTKALNDEKQALFTAMSEMSAYLRRSHIEEETVYCQYGVFFKNIASCIQELLGCSRANNLQEAQEALCDMKKRISDDSIKLSRSTSLEPINKDTLSELKDMKDVGNILSGARNGANIGIVDYRRLVLSILCALACNDSIEQLAAEISDALKAVDITPLYHDELPKDNSYRGLFRETHPDATEIPGLFINVDGSWELFGNHQGTVSRERTDM